MLRKFTELTLLFSILVSGCHRSVTPQKAQPDGGPTPPSHSTAGNGGSPLRLLLEQGRVHASSVLKRLGQADLQKESVQGHLKPGDLEWLEKYRMALAEDILKSPILPVDALPSWCAVGDCACTGSSVGSMIYVLIEKEGEGRCASRLRSKQDAGRVLLHETVHHFPESDEERANRIAAAVYEAWGHPDYPHWLDLNRGIASHLGEQYPVWTGEVLLSCFGEYLNSYDPRTNTTTKIPTRNSYFDLIRDRYFRPDGSAWADEKMLMFGECGKLVRYDARKKEWEWSKAISQPKGRAYAHYFTAGSKVVMWGGADCETTAPLADGGIYDPALDRWTPIPENPLFRERTSSSVVWAGDRLIVWGGVQSKWFHSIDSDLAFREKLPVTRHIGDGSRPAYYNDGAEYRPETGSWTKLPEVDLVPRYDHAAVWTGEAVIVYGGKDEKFEGEAGRSGALYYPSQRRWEKMKPGGPDMHLAFHATWAGTHMVVFGRGQRASYTPFLAFYEPSLGEWTQWKRATVPAFQGLVYSYWTGLELIVLNGLEGYALYF